MYDLLLTWRGEDRVEYAKVDLEEMLKADPKDKAELD